MTISRAYSAMVAMSWIIVPFLVATLMAYGLSVVCAGYLQLADGMEVPWTAAPPVQLLLLNVE